MACASRMLPVDTMSALSPKMTSVPTSFLPATRARKRSSLIIPIITFSIGDEPSMRDKPENIRRKSVRQAVEEALESYNKDHGTVSFCGIPVRVSGYHVVPALLIPRDSLLPLPHLPAPITFDRWTSQTSIVEALLYRLLTEASEGLGSKEPGRFLDEFREDTPGLLSDS